MQPCYGDKQVGIIKRQTAAPLETRFLQETGFLDVQFIYDRLLNSQYKKFCLERETWFIVASQLINFVVSKQRNPVSGHFLRFFG